MDNKQEMSSKTHQKQGFTLIEIVLVLAIAGLIFAAVFIGLPVLQRNQRDMQRKEAVNLVFAAVQTYYAKNGKMPYIVSAKEYNGRTYRNVADVDFRDKTFISRYVDSDCVLENSGRGGDNLIYFSKCGEEFTSPSGNPYILYTHSTSSASNSEAYAYGGVTENMIVILPYSDCENSKNRYKPNNFKVTTILENGVTYCVDNS